MIAAAANILQSCCVINHKIMPAELNIRSCKMAQYHELVDQPYNHRSRWKYLCNIIKKHLCILQREIDPIMFTFQHNKAWHRNKYQYHGWKIKLLVDWGRCALLAESGKQDWILEVHWFHYVCNRNHPWEHSPGLRVVTFRQWGHNVKHTSWDKLFLLF